MTVDYREAALLRAQNDGDPFVSIIGPDGHELDWTVATQDTAEQTGRDLAGHHARITGQAVEVRLITKEGEL